jgi:hypothetical protein
MAIEDLFIVTNLWRHCNNASHLLQPFRGHGNREPLLQCFLRVVITTIATPMLHCDCIMLLHDQHVAICIPSNALFVAIDTIATPIVVAIIIVATLSKCCKSVKSVAIEGLCVATKT